jgi:hypothetical protein
VLPSYGSYGEGWVLSSYGSYREEWAAVLVWILEGGVGCCPCMDSRGRGGLYF